MSAQSEPQATITRSTSRRALLVGALGGVGAWVAAAVGRASPVHAEGEAMVVGGEYFTATSQTYLANASTTSNVFVAESYGAGTGLFGTSGTGHGVFGRSFGAGKGVWGKSSSGVGVDAESITGPGVKRATPGSTTRRRSGERDVNPRFGPSPRGDHAFCRAGALRSHRHVHVGCVLEVNPIEPRRYRQAR